MRRRGLAGALAAGALVALAASAFALDPVGGTAAAAGANRRPSLSDDGSRLAFESTARLSPEDTDKRQDVYVVDLPAGAPRRLPRSATSVLSGGPCLSSDGHAAAYHVVEAVGKPGVQPLTVVLIHDLETGRSHRVPPGWFGLKADGEALFPSLGRNGRIVAFTSNAPRLGVKRTPPVRGVYVFEPDSDRVRLVSRNAKAVAANRPSAEAKISADGRFVGFLSAATNLDPPLAADSLGNHLYLSNRSSGTLTRVDVIERGFDPVEWIPGRFDIDDHGAALVFEARQRKPGKPNESLKTNDLFLFDVSSGAVTRVTSGLFSGHAHSPALSGSGRWTAFVFDGAGADKGGLVVYDRSRNLWRRVVDGVCENPAISGDGRVVAFESKDASITGQKNLKSQIFVVDNPSWEPEAPVHAGD